MIRRLYIVRPGVQNLTGHTIIMKIEHIAIWVKDPENMREFYEKYFEARSGDVYHNRKTAFQSRFLSFGDGCRLELMHRPDIQERTDSHDRPLLGIVHLSISVGSRDEVDRLTERLRKDGYTVAGEPRTTGDGYYESVILDPESNRVEITV